MSKIEDLKQIYDAAEDAAQCVSIPGESFIDMMHRAQLAGIAAVVRAVRDEFGRIMYPGDDWNRQGILKQFDQILGDAGSEKVAGSTPEGAVLSSSAKGEPPASPATAHAPAVCVWTKLPKFGFSISCTDKWLINSNYGGDTCPECGRLIEYKFTEAKT